MQGCEQVLNAIHVSIFDMFNAFGSSCSLSPEGLILLIMKKVTFTQIQLYNDQFLMVFETSGLGTRALRGASLQDFS